MRGENLFAICLNLLWSSPGIEQRELSSRLSEFEEGEGKVTLAK